MRRRPLLYSALPLAGGLAGCSAWVDEAARGPAPPREAPARPGVGGAAPPPEGGPRAGAALQRLDGGFLAPAQPVSGLLPRASGGMYVKLRAPTALALRDVDLLVADAADGRLWRANLVRLTLVPVAGAPVGVGTGLWLGPDHSAWVMDPATRQVLRFGADGRLLQTWRGGGPAAGGFAVLDGGDTVLVADATRAGWSQWRSGGAVALLVRPQRADGSRLSGVDALAAGRRDLYVLEQAHGAVHRVTRDGQVVETLAGGLAGTWSSLVVDADEQVWLLDGAGRTLLHLTPGQAPRPVTASVLGVQLIGGLAVEGRTLAVSDRLSGTVLLFDTQSLLAAAARPEGRA